MPKYLITRSSSQQFVVEADNEDEALDRHLDGESTLLDDTTFDLDVEPHEDDQKENPNVT